MKIETIASTIGGGSLALVAGGVLTAFSIAQAIAHFLPDWAKAIPFAVVGLAFMGLGAYLVTRGAKGAEHKVENTIDRVEERVSDAFDLEQQVRTRPFVAMGGAVVGGLLLAKLLPLPIPFLFTRRNPRPQIIVTDRAGAEQVADGGSFWSGLTGMAGRFALQQGLTLAGAVAQTALTAMFAKQAAEQGAAEGQRKAAAPRRVA